MYRLLLCDKQRQCLVICWFDEAWNASVISAKVLQDDNGQTGCQQLCSFVSGSHQKNHAEWRGSGKSGAGRAYHNLYPFQNVRHAMRLAPTRRLCCVWHHQQSYHSIEFAVWWFGNLRLCASATFFRLRVYTIYRSIQCFFSFKFYLFDNVVEYYGRNLAKFSYRTMRSLQCLCNSK